MRPQSAKAKGRRFQQWVRDMLLSFSPELEPDDIRSTSMGAPGEDILFSPAARNVYPFSIECKNVEKLNIWKAITQAEENAGEYTPAVVFKRNGVTPYVAIPFEDFMRLYNFGSPRIRRESVYETGTSKNSNQGPTKGNR